MKPIILWTSLIGAAIILAVVWDRITVMTLFNKSPLYMNVIFALLGLHLFIGRAIRIYQQLF